MEEEEEEELEIVQRKMLLMIDKRILGEFNDRKNERRQFIVIKC